LDIHPFGFLYPNINGEYIIDEFPKKKIFYFLEYWPIPFGVLQTCCKIQKCKKIIFVMLRNPCENTFSKLPIFFA
jgi:hypothetical protein